MSYRGNLEAAAARIAALGRENAALRRQVVSAGESRALEECSEILELRRKLARLQRENGVLRQRLARVPRRYFQDEKAHAKKREPTAECRPTSCAYDRSWAKRYYNPVLDIWE